MRPEITEYLVNVARGTGYESLVSSGTLEIDKDFIYFCTDTRRIYLGDQEFTHPSLVVDSIDDPNSFFTENYRKIHSNSLVIDKSNHVGYVIDSSGNYDIKSVIDITSEDISSQSNGNVVVSVTSPTPGSIKITLDHAYDLISDEVGTDISSAINSLNTQLTNLINETIDTLGTSAAKYNTSETIDRDRCTLTSVSYDPDTNTLEFIYSAIRISYDQIFNLSDKLADYLTLSKFEEFLGSDYETGGRSFSELHFIIILSTDHLI